MSKTIFGLIPIIWSSKPIDANVENSWTSGKNSLMIRNWNQWISLRVFSFRNSHFRWLKSLTARDGKVFALFSSLTPLLCFYLVKFMLMGPNEGRIENAIDWCFSIVKNTFSSSYSLWKDFFEKRAWIFQRFTKNKS